MTRHLSGMTQLWMHHHLCDSLFNSAYCASNMFSTKIRAQGVLRSWPLITNSDWTWCTLNGYCLWYGLYCNFTQFSKLISHVKHTSGCTRTESWRNFLKKTRLRWNDVWFDARPARLTLTLLVKYDTTKMKLKARPAMCLLHCMLTCRHTAAGTWLLAWNQSGFKTCCLFQSKDI